MKSRAQSEELRAKSPERPRAPTDLKTKFTVWYCSQLSAATVHLNHGWTRINTDAQSKPRRCVRILGGHRSVAFRISNGGWFSRLYPCPFVSIRGFLLHGCLEGVEKGFRQVGTHLMGVCFRTEIPTDLVDGSESRPYLFRRPLS